MPSLSLTPSSWLSGFTKQRAAGGSARKGRSDSWSEGWDGKDGEEAHELLNGHGDANGSASTGNTANVTVKGRLSQGSDRLGSSLRNVRIRTWLAAIFVVLLLGSGALYRHKRDVVGKVDVSTPSLKTLPWKKFPRLDGYYRGLEWLVSPEEFIAENGPSSADVSEIQLEERKTSKRDVAFKPTPYNPPLHEHTGNNVPQRVPCFLDTTSETPGPQIYAFNGIPQGSPDPLYGSYEALDLNKDVCFERYGRLGPYGLGYEIKNGGTGLGMHGDRSLTEPVWEENEQIDWRNIDLGLAQRKCLERNKERFGPLEPAEQRVGSLAEISDEDLQDGGREDGKVPRSALILRAWAGMQYSPGMRMYIRSLVNELSLYTSGEYTVHLLVEVKDSSLPIWTSTAAYDAVLEDLVPAEFRGMATLWNQQLMRLIYPGPFEPHFAEHGDMYPAMRSMHFALQWFMVTHPEYEFFWNWEVDVRYTGHWYELLDTVTRFAKRQPMEDLWDRNARFYVPSLFGDSWDAFVQDTAKRSRSVTTEKEKRDSDPYSGEPPSDFRQTSPSTGTTHAEEDEEGEEADLITLNPMFDPDATLWNRRNDVSGYDTSRPIPQRRSSIIVASRFSRHLLQIMHNETYVNKHSMGSEMFPPSMCLHHGLKAVFAPHPVYMERDWGTEFAEHVLNGGGPGKWSGGFEDSVFGEGPKGHEDGMKEAGWYYDSFWAASLWRRWLGYKETERESWEAPDTGRGLGGERQELGKDMLEKEQGRIGEKWKMGGRMCLRGMLLHPVKDDEGKGY